MDKHYGTQCELSLINALNEAVVILHEDGSIQHANPAACQSLNQPLEQLIGHKIQQHLIIHTNSNGIHAYCLSQDNSGLLHTNTEQLCGIEVRKISLPSTENKTNTALIWQPTPAKTTVSKDKTTGLPDLTMFQQEIKPLLTYVDSHHPHSIIQIHLAREQGRNMHGVDPEQLNSLMTDLATLLQRSLRQRDLLARASIDSFVILLRGCPINRAQIIANQLISDIEHYHQEYPDIYVPKWRTRTAIMPIIAGNSVETTFNLLLSACQQACDENKGIITLSTGEWISD